MIQSVLLKNENFGPKVAKLFLKLCLTIHASSKDLSEEIRGISLHVRLTAETILRKGEQEGFDLHEAKPVLERIITDVEEMEGSEGANARSRGP